MDSGVSKTIVIHGCGVANIGKDDEGLTPEGKMRVWGAINEIAHLFAMQKGSDQITSPTFIFCFAGGKAQGTSSQKKSEAAHLHEYFQQLQKKYFPSFSDVRVVLEEKSTDTFENICNIVDKTKSELVDVLDNEKEHRILVHTSAYHVGRVKRIWSNVAKKNKISRNNIAVFATDTMRLATNEHVADYDAMNDAYHTVCKDYYTMRKNRSRKQKILGSITEIVGTAFAMINMDSFLSKIHEKLAGRKSKQSKEI